MLSPSRRPCLPTGCFSILPPFFLVLACFASASSFSSADSAFFTLSSRGGAFASSPGEWCMRRHAERSRPLQNLKVLYRSSRTTNCTQARRAHNSGPGRVQSAARSTDSAYVTGGPTGALPPPVALSAFAPKWESINPSGDLPTGSFYLTRSVLIRTIFPEGGCAPPAG